MPTDRSPAMLDHRNADDGQAVEGVVGQSPSN